VGGKHRSVSELCELANHSGLQLVAAGSQAEYFVVEFRPA
jgi:hypothetical protein